MKFKNKKYMNQKLYFIAYLLIIVLTLFTSCDTGGEDDGTLGNWFMAIVCLLAWLKGGKR